MGQKSDKQFPMFFKGHWLGADDQNHEGFCGVTIIFLCVHDFGFSEQKSVSIRCTSSIFWAVIKPILLGQDLFLHADIVSLELVVL